jgi:hypothetical protein
MRTTLNGSGRHWLARRGKDHVMREQGSHAVGERVER